MSLYAKPLVLADEQGRLMFAFGPATDPYIVLHAVAWAYAVGQSTCNWDCPVTTGGYCCECHATSYTAAETARQRFP